MKSSKQFCKLFNRFQSESSIIHNDAFPVCKRLSHKGYRDESPFWGCGSKLQSSLKRTYNKILKMLTIPPTHPTDTDVNDKDFKPQQVEQLPVVVVLGSTASGKSKLAIELAKEVGGEVISADSMQVYEGLNILTNKASEEEMKGIPHHMIGVVDRTEKFDVVKFRDLALPLVDKIREKGKIPFIVGGTNYYIESLLWKILVQENNETHDTNEESNAKRQKLHTQTDIVMTPILQFIQDRPANCLESDVIANWTSAEIYNSLQQVDPVRALKIHPNDTRKVIRSIQVFLRTGKMHSTIIEEQSSHFKFEDKNKKDPSMHSTLTPKLGGPLRFNNAICLWIQADRSILNTRIEARVDQMVKAGLQQELNDYVDNLQGDKRLWDFQGGQLQSIGVKEFQAYIQLLGEERQTTVGHKLFDEGLERLKIVTKQYAKRQVQWMKCRFLDPSRRELPPMYGLNGNNPEEGIWNKNVTAPALSILKAHLNGQLDLPVVLEKRVKPTQETAKLDFLARTCDVCNKVLSGSIQWEEHMKSAKHKKMVKRKKILEGLTTQVIESTNQ